MEFKGTKGNLTIRPAKGFKEETLYYNVEHERQNIASFNPNEHIEVTLEIAKANAVLFSKAPEMLEMLIEILYGCENGLISDLDELGDKVKELIKEATTLK